MTDIADRFVGRAEDVRDLTGHAALVLQFGDGSSREVMTPEDLDLYLASTGMTMDEFMQTEWSALMRPELQRALAGPEFAEG